MGIKTILDKLKQFFCAENLLSFENFDNSVHEVTSVFKAYNVVAADLYYLYTGPFEERIYTYLIEKKKDLTDFFPVTKNDYISVFGAVDISGKKFILFLVYDDTFERQIGNFAQVLEWPSFSLEIERVKDVMSKLYKEFGTK